MARVNGAEGALIVDKPAGPTSHDVVAEARRWYRTREVGHAGTLDPFATGVLVLLFGRACKLSAHLTAAEKSYVASVEFGRSTESFDATGATVEQRPVSLPGPGELEAALAAERARVLQVPPAVSAIRVGGERAHRATRRGAPPDLEPRPVRVHKLCLTARHGRTVELELTVSKGYYVRALARDLGAALGMPAHLSALRRTASGCFTLAEATPWPPPSPAPLLPLADLARRALPWAALTEEGQLRARHGKILEPSHFASAPPRAERICAWIGPSGELVALGTSAGPERWRVARGISPRS
jgi:tRNA pseudouridine55 synthase